MKGVKSKLVVQSGDSKKEYAKEEDISAEIRAVLGIPHKSRILKDFLFVDQWSVFDFLVSRDSERAETFQRLIEISKITDVWNMLGREASPADSGTRKTANSAESR